MVKNVNHAARLQWKVDTIKNCIYLQCGLILIKTFWCCCWYRSSYKGVDRFCNIIYCIANPLDPCKVKSEKGWNRTFKGPIISRFLSVVFSIKYDTDTL